MTRFRVSEGNTRVAKVGRIDPIDHVKEKQGKGDGGRG